MGKLHDQMRDDLLLKACSPSTLRSYLGCVHHFVFFLLLDPKGPAIVPVSSSQFSKTASSTTNTCHWIPIAQNHSKILPLNHP